MGGLHAVLYNRGCIVLVGEIIRGRPGRTVKCLTPRYRVGDFLFDDDLEVLWAIHVIVDVMQEWKESLLHGVDIIVSRLTGNKREVISCHCKHGGDFVGGSHRAVVIDRGGHVCCHV